MSLISDEVNGGRFDTSMGTIGHGNHFCELQKIEKILCEKMFKKLNMNADLLYLTVHSGSRGLGFQVLEKHLAKFQSKGLSVGIQSKFQKISFILCKS